MLDPQELRQAAEVPDGSASDYSNDTNNGNHHGRTLSPVLLNDASDCLTPGELGRRENHAIQPDPTVCTRWKSDPVRPVNST